MKTEGIVKTEQAYVRQFNGQRVKLSTAENKIGASGETALYVLNSGAGIYLKQSEIE